MEFFLIAKKPTYDELEKRAQDLETQIFKQNRFQIISHALFKISSAINTTTDLNALYKSIHDELSHIIDTTNFFIAIYDQAKDKITFPYCVDSVDECYPPVIEICKTESLTAKVIRTGMPLLITKDEIMHQRQKSQREIPVCTPSELWLGVPLKIEAGIIGVMAVQSYDDADCYDQTDLEVMASVADQVALAIEKKTSEKALRESEEKHRLLFDSAGDAIFIHDTEARMLAVNQTACIRLGYSHAELMSMTIDQVDTLEEAKHASNRIARLMEQGHFTFETVHQRRNGSFIPTDVTARRITWGNKPAMMSICRDITERKQAEVAREQLISQLKAALDKVKKLSGFLPICSYCKKIRDDKGYWKQIENYIRDHSEAEFSHSICRECAKKHYPGLDLHD